MSDIKLNEKERIDDLQFKNLKIIQNEDYFCFGLDAVLLARFSMPKDNDKIIDLGTGTGIIPIMLSGLCASERIVGIDIQDCMVDIASRSIELNNLSNRVKIEKCDIKDIGHTYEKESFSLAVTNPPYIKAGNGIVNELSQQCNIKA